MGGKTLKQPKASQNMRVLHENGSLGGADGDAKGDGAVLLSRALCRFRLFRAPPGLSRTHLARAARTHAEANAPFVETGALLLRSPHGAEIWYWDKARVATGVSAKALSTLAPESLFREAGEGWRILVCAEGFEAQYWQGGGLVASTWRRHAFTREQWIAFAMGVEAATHEPPDVPPAPMNMRLLARTLWRGREIKPPLTWRDAETAAVSFALCASGLAAFFVGQGLHFSADARDSARQAAAIETSIASNPALQRARARVELLRAFNTATAGADALTAAVDALAVLEQFGVEAESWRADQAGFHATLSASITDIPLRDVVAALEATPLLCGVEPNLSSREDALELSAALETAGAVCVANDIRGRRS
mgnify:CR=1 FL=1